MLTTQVFLLKLLQAGWPVGYWTVTQGHDGGVTPYTPVDENIAGEKTQHLGLNRGAWTRTLGHDLTSVNRNNGRIHSRRIGLSVEEHMVLPPRQISQKLRRLPMPWSVSQRWGWSLCSRLPRQVNFVPSPVVGINELLSNTPAALQWQPTTMATHAVLAL